MFTKSLLVLAAGVTFGSAMVHQQRSSFTCSDYALCCSECVSDLTFGLVATNCHGGSSAHTNTCAGSAEGLCCEAEVLALGVGIGCKVPAPVTSSTTTTTTTTTSATVTSATVTATPTPVGLYSETCTTEGYSDFNTNFGSVCSTPGGGELRTQMFMNTCLYYEPGTADFVCGSHYANSASAIDFVTAGCYYSGIYNAIDFITNCTINGNAVQGYYNLDICVLNIDGTAMCTS